MAVADFLVVGGGVAGLSAAAALSGQGRVVLLEAEEAIGYHSSGRSATFSHYGIGKTVVRGLTSWSREFFLNPPEGFAEAPLAVRTPALFVARETEVPALDALGMEMARFTSSAAPVDEREMLALCPVLRTGPGAVVAGVADRGGLRLDSHALLQGYARMLRASGGALHTGAPLAAVRRKGGGWEAETAAGESFTAPVLVNAAGAWADRVATLAGVRPLALRPTRRTIIQFDPPPGIDVRSWPFLKTAVDEFYMLPDAGRLLASPVDEIDAEPGDVQAEDYEVALAAWLVEQYTTLSVPRVTHRWAGLRTFTADRVPTAGFAPDASGFFWLAGQGGYGLQTAPAMAAIVEALVTGGGWPLGLAELGVTPERVGPDRLFDDS